MKKIKTKITQMERDIISVYARSSKDADGWAKVSAALWPFMSEVRAEFMEREIDPNGGGRVRLTTIGNTLLEYAI